MRRKLGKRRYERLVSELAMVIGWEALIVARDVRGLSQKEAQDASAWAARSLVHAALEEAARAAPRKSARAADAAGNLPSGTLLGVARLARPELLVEIEATAVR